MSAYRKKTKEVIRVKYHVLCLPLKHCDTLGKLLSYSNLHSVRFSVTERRHYSSTSQVLTVGLSRWSLWHCWVPALETSEFLLALLEMNCQIDRLFTYPVSCQQIIPPYLTML